MVLKQQCLKMVFVKIQFCYFMILCFKDSHYRSLNVNILRQIAPFYANNYIVMENDVTKFT